MRLNSERNEIPKYNGSNYEEWKFSMQALLLEKGLFHVVSETKPVPENPKNVTAEDKKKLLDYMTQSGKVKGTLCKHMEMAYMANMMEMETAYEIWDALARKNNNTTAESLLILRNLFYSPAVNMREGENVNEHLAKLRNIQSRTKGSKAPIVDEELISRIMSSLPESWSGYVQGLRGASNELTYETLEVRLQAEMNLRASNEASNEEVWKGAAFHTKNMKKKFVQSNSKLKCWNCDKPGHRQADCWAPGGGKQGQGPKRNRNASTATKVYGMHISKNVKKEVALTKTDWILDSGANSHFTNDKSYLVEYQAISPVTIQVAKGNATMKAIGKGKLRLKPNKPQSHIVELNEVLYVPELETNLISLSQVDQKGYTYQGGSNKITIY
jgi:hypothetical protein